MFVIRRILFFGICFVSCLAVLALGIYGYIILQDLTGPHALTLKYYSENLIYLAIIFTAVLILIYTLTALHSRRLLKHLKKAADIIHYGEEEIADHLKKLGPLGHQIGSLYYELNRLNDIKTLKISALANLNNFLIDNIDMKLLACDGAGRITHCSKKFITESEKDKNFFVGKDIDEIMPGFNINELLLELKTSRKAVTRKENDSLFYPIFNAQDRLSSIVWIMEGKEIAPEVAKKSEQIKAPEVKSAKKFFGRLLRG